MSRPRPILRRLSILDAHHKVLIALAAALAVFLLTEGNLLLHTQLLAAWVAFTLSHLLLAWNTILHEDPRDFSRLAKLQDSGRTAIFIIIVSASCASLLAVGMLLVFSKGLSRGILTGHAALSFLAIVFSWLLIHTIYALHYAHIYVGNEAHPGGLQFPSDSRERDRHPGYIDFCYFSFVIGMTCQVSDVQITSMRLRTLALVHGIISFGYNTVILAMTINVIASLML